MPWSSKNPPRPAKNWPKSAQSLCIRVANGVLRDGGSDQDAIFACISAVKKKFPGAIKTPKSKQRHSAIEITTQVYALPRIDLEEVKAKKPTVLQILPEGKFQHPWYGELDFTAPVLRAAKRNFDNKVLTIDIMVDEGHDRGRALGWFKELHTGKRKIGDTEYSGLFGGVEWTDLGRDLLERGIYRYFSAEIGSFTSPEAQKVPNVLFGGGLTNRPFFKKMPAVKLSDPDGHEIGRVTDRFTMGLFADPLWQFTAVPDDEEEEDDRTFFAGYDFRGKFAEEEVPDDDDDDPDEEEEVVNYADLIKKLKKDFGITLSDDADEDDITEAFSTLVLSPKARTELEGLGVEFKDGTPASTAIIKAFKAVKTSADENSAAIKEIRTELADTKADSAVALLVQQGKITPAQKERYVKLFKTDHDLFEEMTKDMTPTVDLEEHGGDGESVEPGSATAEQFKDPVKATEEADRYMHLVPTVAERLPANGRK